MEVRAESVRFKRGDRTIIAVDQLRFPHGSTTALFGPNGSGKTTLLRLIAGLERPTAGTIWLGDRRVISANGKSLPVAMAFQRSVFLRGSVRANLALGLRLRGVAGREIDSRVNEAAVEFGIVELLDRPASSLSGGEAQRVNLARALCLRSAVTLLDEPLSGLDRVARGRFLEELPHLLQTFATTTILVTHDREEAFRLADHLVVMVDGQVRAAGRSGEVYRSPPDALTAELLGYMTVRLGDAVFAVPPGGLRLGTGPRSVEVVVERVVDMGNHRDVVGRVGDSIVTVRLREGDADPQKGARLAANVQAGIPLS